MNNLHVKPTYGGHFNKFIEVIECIECGIVGVKSGFRLYFEPCPNCGANGPTSYKIYVARWEEYEKIEGVKFVWYSPKTWKGQKRTLVGAWVCRDLLNEI